MITRNPTVIFLADGMADEVSSAPTPLQSARTPAMDSIARDGICGSLLTLPDGFPTSSDVANMSVLGCDLESEYCGRGVLEAASQGLALAADEIAFRLNLVTETDGLLVDFAGGHPHQEAAEALIGALQKELGSDTARFLPGVSYRNLLIVKGHEFTASVMTDKPDDYQGQPVIGHLPRGHDSRSRGTAELLCALIAAAKPVLAGHPLNRAAMAGGRPPANAIWPWSGGKAGSMRTLTDRFGISGAVISAVDVIRGLGKCLGMDVIDVAGATGYIDTNYEGKADAAVAALCHYDLVYVHVEAIDEVSHARDRDLKIKTIEDFDSRLVSRVLGAIQREATVVVLPDHPVPVRLGRHTRTPVPVAVRRTGQTPDAVMVFDEAACLSGALGALHGADLMHRLFGAPRSVSARNGSNS